MSDREKFEAWAKTSDGNCNDRDLERRHDGDYHNMLVQRDWEVWQASRRAALEEAAQVCEALESRISKAMVAANENEGAPIDGGYLNACDDCADAIRALAEGDKQ